MSALDDLVDETLGISYETWTECRAELAQLRAAGEAEYTRLTTLGKIIVGQPLIADLRFNLTIAGLNDEAEALTRAYVALEHAASKLRGEN